MLRRTAAVVLLSLLTGQLAAQDTQGLKFFETRIRPVLVKHCHECHSAAADAVKGGLRLDHADAVSAGGDSGPPIASGDPDASLLMEALRFEGLEMPPSGRLDDNVLADFAAWIEMGAPFPATPRGAGVSGPSGIDLEKGRQFWAFQPPRVVQPPATTDSVWPRSDIDHFILARLEAAGLQPASDADRTTLLRRLYFDLIGLPPPPEAIDDFLNDDSVDAVERVVDRLLNTSQFGEHWARHWFDVARYSDSNGNDFNATFHNAWRYRNYVIQSFNDDKPYDQFVREQIAGDLLPFTSDRQRTDQLVATAFLMLGPKMLSERDKAKLQMDVVDEQIDTVGRAFVGLTLGCARCHDHKFDPIPTEDYYALAGIFKSTRTLDGEMQQYVSNWVRRDLPIAPELAREIAGHRKQVASLKRELAAARKAVASLPPPAARRGIVLDDKAAKFVGTWKASTYSPSFIGSGYRHDENRDKGEKSVTFETKLPVAGEYEVRLSWTAAKGRARAVPIEVAHADGVANRTLNQEKKPAIDGLFGPVGRFRFLPDRPATVTIRTTGTSGYVIVDAVQFISMSELTNPTGDGDGGAAEKAATAARQRVAELEKQLKAVEKHAPPKPQALAPAEATQIGGTELRIRGEYNNKGPMIPRGFLQVLPGHGSEFPSDASGRLELAEWIASPDNPLTARVMVNRLWHHLLGAGLVRTVDNFGRLGERPSHPDLMDHLASTFVEDGWSVRRAIRRIVLSRTYQMSSNGSAGQAEDAENRLLWRAHRRPLPAEAIRDSLLAISGQLDTTPVDSVVAHLGRLVNTNAPGAAEYEDTSSSRRSVYLPIIRNELPTILSVFDFADPDMVVGKRPRTNVPAQALLLLNNPFVRDCAQRTAEGFATDAGALRERVTGLWRSVLGRPPGPEEMRRAIAFLEEWRAETGSLAEGADGSLQGWTHLVHALFASAEFRRLN